MDDSGYYVCTVTAGIYSVQERLELRVEEDPPPPVTTPPPRPQAQETPYHHHSRRRPEAGAAHPVCAGLEVAVRPSSQTVGQGEAAVLQCEVTVAGAGAGDLAVTWSKVRDVLDPATATIATQEAEAGGWVSELSLGPALPVSARGE